MNTTTPAGFQPRPSGEVDRLAELRNRHFDAKPLLERAREAQRRILFTVDYKRPPWLPAKQLKPFNELIKVGVSRKALDRLDLRSDLVPLAKNTHWRRSGLNDASQ